MSLCVYSSQTARWSEPTYVARPPQYGVDVVPTALVGNALYFVIDVSRSILKYDLATRKASVIHQPAGSCGYFTALMTMEDGGLQVARVEGHRLFLSSMEAGPGGDVGWARIRVIELDKLLRVDALSIAFDFVGFAHGVGRWSLFCGDE
uniref:F-box associated domain-containing protein n=1 Tax=Arundo donax TaxID=35708 RepID=A0A0A9HM51_ARUDO